MSLTLELQSNLGTNFSSEGALTAPLSLTFDGIIGGEKEVQVLLTNGYSNTITLDQIEATNVTNYNSDIEHVQFKLALADTYVSTLTPAISLAQSASQGFYMKVSVHPGRSVINIKDIGLKVTWS